MSHSGRMRCYCSTSRVTWTFERQRPNVYCVMQRADCLVEIPTQSFMELKNSSRQSFSISTTEVGSVLPLLKLKVQKHLLSVNFCGYSITLCCYSSIQQGRMLLAFCTCAVAVTAAAMAPEHISNHRIPSDCYQIGFDLRNSFIILSESI